MQIYVYPADIILDKSQTLKQPNVIFFRLIETNFFERCVNQLFQSIVSNLKSCVENNTERNTKIYTKRLHERNKNHSEKLRAKKA